MDRETRDMLLETADRFFTERCGKDIVNGVEKGVWPADLWKEIEEMGLPLIAVPEDKGGAGGTLADMLAVLRLAGSHAVPVPLAETALANLLIAAAGRRAGNRARARWRWATSCSRAIALSGKVDRVPFAAVADRFVDRGQCRTAGRWSPSCRPPTPASTRCRAMPASPTAR